MEREERQHLAVQRVLDHDQYSVIEFPTGVGKTYTAILLYHALQGLNEQIDTVDIVVPKRVMRDGWEQELSTHDISGSVYTIHKYVKLNRQPDLLIVDEIHNCAGENAFVFPRVLDTAARYAVGLSATLDQVQKNFLATKNWAVADRMDLGEALTSGYIPDYQVYNVQLELTKSERSNYEHVDSQYHKGMRFFGYDFDQIQRCLKSDDECQRYLDFLGGEQQQQVNAQQVKGFAVMVMKNIRGRKNIVQNADAKLQALSRINDSYNEKTIVFGETNQFANHVEEVLDDAIAYHSKHSTRSRKKRFEQFLNDKKINILVSSRVLNEGVDLPSLNLGVIASYNSNPREVVQRVGRLLRGSRPTIFIFYMRDTQEEKWLRKSQANIPAAKISTITYNDL